MENAALERELDYWEAKVHDRPDDPNAYVRRGMAHFKLAHIQASIADFDHAEYLDANLIPYLWQRGLSFYYAERFADGATQFETDLQVNSQDVEETVWRYLCIARWQDAATARKSLLVVKHDPRPFMESIYTLYGGNCSAEEVLAAGMKAGDRGRFYTHLYVGLYYEAADHSALAREHILIAADDYRLDDYMWYLARVHKQLRGWE